MLPLGGLAMAIFTGWLMSRTSSMDELKVKQNIYNAWRFVIRYLSPVGVTIIFLNSIGSISVIAGFVIICPFSTKRAGRVYSSTTSIGLSVAATDYSNIYFQP